MPDYEKQIAERNEKIALFEAQMPKAAKSAERLIRNTLPYPKRSGYPAAPHPAHRLQ